MHQNHFYKLVSVFDAGHKNITKSLKCLMLYIMQQLLKIFFSNHSTTHLIDFINAGAVFTENFKSVLVTPSKSN